MLGSLTEAEDAVQEAWLRLYRADTGDVRDLRAWLTTVVSRVCLDMLRSRASRREDSLEDVHLPDPIVTRVDDDPAEHAILADSVGIALLVVLDTLSPAERLAFVLHDVFAVPFEQIGPILDRSPGRRQATGEPRQAAAARRPGAPRRRAATGEPDSPRRVPPTSAVGGGRCLPRRVAGGRLRQAARHPRPRRGAAGRRGRRPFGPSTLVRGAREVIAQAQRFAPLGRFARPVLVNGGPGFLVARDGEPLALMAVTVRDDRITEMDVLADPDRLARLDLTAVLPSAGS